VTVTPGAGGNVGLVEGEALGQGGGRGRREGHLH
jgi:hypothetical protein